MSYSTRIALALLLVGTATAEAQLTPGGGMPGGAGQQQEEQKKEGVAEAAPKATGLLPTTPALPPPKGRRKRWKLFEIDGYFRLRTDWFKNFHLGHIDDPALGGAAFPRALSCSTSAIVGAGCDDALSSANMRLRLEPTINLDERTSIHVQADILDNLVLGSTPVDQNLSSYDDMNLPPVGAFSGTQSPPVAGVNSDRDSLAVKRAWAEVAVPLGILKFGRQPNHWGMGIWHNAGGEDPINGGYDTEADYGDSVDRVSFSTQIPGTNLRAMVAADWDLTRLVSNQTSANKGREGHPWDLDDKDDSNGWVAVISRMDSPQEFRDRVDRGEIAFNYGAYFEYKTQSFDNDLRDFTLGGTLDSETRFVPRDLKTYSPDVWAKLGIGQFTVEAELVAQLGRVSRLDEFGLSAADIRKFGGTGRFTFRGLEGKLRLGVETGAASGDQWDNTPQGNTHIAYASLLGGPGDRKLTQFLFNREYKIDMILFRHLIGAVTNAGYVKPFLSYELTKSIGFRVANITSFALKPVATPGNETMYGTEFNADIGYSSGGFYGGVAYGVLFPFGALSHPADTETETFGYGTNSETGESNVGDAGTAHTIQFKLILSF
ncbi:MAG TPA: TIGR04551 family protein [Kofleriaceae bacterium]|nr:TIGR04551 family protein [Kofleriaceae bacterium]